MGSPSARLLVVSALIAASLAVGELGAGATSIGAAASPLCRPLPAAAGSVSLAPYVDVTLSGQPTLDQVACDSHLSHLSLAFFTAKSSTCAPALAGSSYQNGFLDVQVVRLRTLGGDVIGSFGGAVGTELALACPSASALAAAYQKVVDYYQLSAIDFDVEGTAVTNAAANARRAAAISILEHHAAATGRRLAVSFTLEVEPSGIPSSSLSVLRAAVARHDAVSVVNVMTMDFGDRAAPRPSGRMGTYIIQAASSTLRQLRALWPTKSAAQVAAMLGLCPMIGQNDERDEIFTLANAAGVLGWARNHHIGRITYWSVARDRQCASGINRVAQGTCSGVLQSTYAFAHALGAP
jgi:hypothetical protein